MKIRSSLALIPPELQILIAKELDYFSLKSFAATCRQNFDLVMSPAFDQILFRGPPAAETPKEEDGFDMHPIIYLVDNWIIDRFEHAEIWAADPDVNKHWKCLDLSACDENATSPAVATLCVDIPALEGSDLVELKQSSPEKGVTVRQVITQIVTAWNWTLRDDVGVHYRDSDFQYETHWWEWHHRHMWQGWEGFMFNEEDVLTLYPNETEYEAEEYFEGPLRVRTVTTATSHYTTWTNEDGNLRAILA